MDQTIKLKSKTGDIVEFNSQLENFTLQIQPQMEKQSEITIEQATTKSLEIMKEFLQAHNYSPTKMSWNLPIKSNNLEDHIDSTSYSVFNKYTQYDFRENSKILVPLVELAYIINFKELKKISNIALQVQLHCNMTERDVKLLKEQYDISEENLNPQLQRKIIQENPKIFTQIRNNFKNNLNSAYEGNATTTNTSANQNNNK